MDTVRHKTRGMLKKEPPSVGGRIFVCAFDCRGMIDEKEGI